MCYSFRIGIPAILIAVLSCQLTAAPIDEIQPLKEQPEQDEAFVPNGKPTPAIDGDILNPNGRNDAPALSEKPFGLVLAEPHGPSSADHPPSESDVAIQEAIKEFKSGNIDKCRSHLRDAVAKKPNLPPPDLLLADIYLGAGLHRQARSILEEAATSGVSHPQMHFTFGRLALAEGRLVEALMHYEKMEQLGAPSGWRDDEKTEFESAILAGKTWVAERRSHWMLAQSLLAQWVQSQPKDAALRSRWATALLRAGHEEKSFDQFDIAYRQDNRLNRPETAVASVYAHVGRFTEANRWYAKSLDTDPTDSRTHFAWSIALAMQDRWNEAEARAARAAELGIDSKGLGFHRGVIARAQRKYEDAEMYLSRVLELSPSDGEATYQLILTLAAQGDIEKGNRALKLAQASVANQPQSITARSALGVALAGTKEYVAAEQTFSEIAENLRPEPLFIYAKLLAKLDKPDQARSAALRLRRQIDEPGIFVARPAAREWLNSVLP